MKRHEGFTLVELLITMTVMVILLILVVVNLRSNEATARDEKRKTDVAAIAKQLETYYEAGTATTSPGHYPGTTEMDTEAHVKTALPDVDSKALRAPDVPTSDPISLIVATTAAAQTPSINTYTYQPLTASNALCTSSGSAIATECRKFIIYYTLETVSGTQTIKSQHQ